MFREFDLLSDESRFVTKFLWGCLAITLVVLFCFVGIYIGRKTVSTGEMISAEAAVSGVDININVD